VRSIDFRRPSDPAAGPANVDFRAADLTDQGQTWELISEFDPDYVVHYAAYPNPLGHGGAHVYENNTISTYNVLSGAGDAGADVVWASSETVYGTVFAEPSFLPDYFPIDVDHPKRPEDPYGTSKVAGEEIAKMVTRRYDVSVASIRPSWIQAPGEYSCRDPDYVDDLSAGAGNFWSYVDVRDVAEMVVAALDADLAGHEAFNCVARDNALGRPLRELLREQYGRVPAEFDVEGDASAYATRKAADMLDWTPEHSWRDAAEESVSAPTV